MATSGRWNSDDTHNFSCPIDPNLVTWPKLTVRELRNSLYMSCCVPARTHGVLLLKEDRENRYRGTIRGLSYGLMVKKDDK